MSGWFQFTFLPSNSGYLANSLLLLAESVFLLLLLFLQFSSCFWQQNCPTTNYFTFMGNKISPAFPPSSHIPILLSFTPSLKFQLLLCLLLEKVGEGQTYYIVCFKKHFSFDVRQTCAGLIAYYMTWDLILSCFKFLFKNQVTIFMYFEGCINLTEMMYIRCLIQS
jgi:hypothetical protein